MEASDEKARAELNMLDKVYRMEISIVGSANLAWLLITDERL